MAEIAQNSKKQRGKPFQKGQSGNPGGRPAMPKEVRDLAATYSTAAVHKLAEWMQSDNPKASVGACQAILNRAFGMPAQQVDLNANVSLASALDEARKRMGED